MIEVIANVAPADPMISGNWIIGLIGAIAAGIALVVGKMQGRKEAESRDVKIQKPVPTIQTREEPRWATKPELEELGERTDKQIGEIWTAIQSERGVARESLSRIHTRIDSQANATAAVQATINEVKHTVGKLLDIALHRKPDHE